MAHGILTRELRVDARLTDKIAAKSARGRPPALATPAPMP